jgi:hypothetical protein
MERGTRPGSARSCWKFKTRKPAGSGNRTEIGTLSELDRRPDDFRLKWAAHSCYSERNSQDHTKKLAQLKTSGRALLSARKEGWASDWEKNSELGNPDLSCGHRK